jgi:hypothetical protein
VVAEEFAVLDISQSGIRFTAPPECGFRLGKRCEAVVRLPSGSSYPVVGTVMRVEGQNISLHFATPLPGEFFASSEADRRAFFRLKYPIAERPRAMCMGGRYEISEISEGGIRISPHNLNDFILGTLVDAVLVFRDGTSQPVQGTIYRYDKGEVVIRLTKQIPASRVFTEQRFIIQKYKRM